MSVQNYLWPPPLQSLHLLLGYIWSQQVCFIKKVILKQVWSLLEKLSAIVWLKAWEWWESNQVNRVKTLSELRILTLGSWFMRDWVLSEIWCFTLHRSFHRLSWTVRHWAALRCLGNIVLSTLIWSTIQVMKFKVWLALTKKKKC